MVYSAYLAVSKQYEINKQEQCVEEERKKKNLSKHQQIEEL